MVELACDVLKAPPAPYNILLSITGDHQYDFSQKGSTVLSKCPAIASSIFEKTRPEGVIFPS